VKKETLGLFLGPAFFIVVLALAPDGALPVAARAIAASALWIATWWITEAVPIPVTALLPLVLFPVTGGLDIRVTASAYGHPLIFLFVGGFMVALAIERWNLHRRIALNIISLVGLSPARILLGFMVATACLSMWISNTATTMMMMPIGIALVSQLHDFEDESDGENKPFAKALMLAIAYSASIGGLATLIGTPTNVIFSGIVKELYNVEVTFAQWVMFGLPLSAALLIICWVYLTRKTLGPETGVIGKSHDEIKEQLRNLGRMSYEEKCVLWVFLLTAVAWISRSFILSKFIPGIDDTVIAILAALILFIIPARRETATRILDWRTASALPWGIVILFGGGLSLATGFKQSGLAEWMGGQMNMLSGTSFFLILFVVVALVNFLTEMTSNVATASMLLPILAAFATGLNVHPFGLMVGACVAASCAFMLPVATPPNAVVFGSGFLSMGDMVRAGIWMNVLSILIVTLYVYFVLPFLWGFDLTSLPTAF